MCVYKVSVCCLTYNHESSLQDTLNGFLMQRGNFKIEIIFYDDFSVDGTRELIRNFAEQYRTRFEMKLIFPPENMRSKDYLPLLEFILPAVSGDYFAICEGDDYWIRPDKLQEQLDILNCYTDANCCFHPSYCLDVRKGILRRPQGYIGRELRILKGTDVVRRGGHGIPTAAIFCRSNLIADISAFLNLCSKPAPVGDLYLQLIAASCDAVIYTPDVSSIYRIGQLNSWSGVQKRLKRKEINNGIVRHLSCLKNLKHFGYVGCDIGYAIFLEVRNSSFKAVGCRDEELINRH